MVPGKMNKEEATSLSLAETISLRRGRVWDGRDVSPSSIVSVNAVDAVVAARARLLRSIAPPITSTSSNSGQWVTRTGTGTPLTRDMIGFPCSRMLWQIWTPFLFAAVQFTCGWSCCKWACGGQIYFGVRNCDRNWDRIFEVISWIFRWLWTGKHWCFSSLFCFKQKKSRSIHQH